jgi:hypothetical protein
MHNLILMFLLHARIAGEFTVDIIFFNKNSTTMQKKC